MLPKKPILKQNYQAVLMSIETMQLRNQENIMLLKGKTVTQLIPTLLPLLDGLHTLDEITDKLSPCPKNVIENTIQLLSEHFVIEEGDSCEDSGISNKTIDKNKNMINFLGLFSERSLPGEKTISKYDLFKSLYEKTCMIYGVQRVGSQLVRSLAASGVGHLVLCDDTIVDENNTLSFYENAKGFTYSAAMKKYLEDNGYEVDITIMAHECEILDNIDILICAEDVITEDELQKINKICVKKSIPWINLKMGELKFQIGPLIVPNETACYECARNRLNGNIIHFKEQKAYENYKNMEKENINIYLCDYFIQIAVNITSWEVIKFLTKIYSAVSTGRVIFFDSLSLELTTSNILKMPKCPICSKRETQPFIEPYAVYLP